MRNIVGALLILVGLFLFVYRGDAFRAGQIFTYFWPSFFMMPLGIFFHWLYFSIMDRKGAGVLVPGGILLTAGIVCQISMLFDLWAYLWPGFILAVAVGLFELYWFGYRTNKWLLVPIFILFALSCMFFFVVSFGSVVGFFSGQPLIAIALVFAGALMLFGRKKGA